MENVYGMNAFIFQMEQLNNYQLSIHSVLKR